MRQQTLNQEIIEKQIQKLMKTRQVIWWFFLIFAGISFSLLFAVNTNWQAVFGGISVFSIIMLFLVYRQKTNEIINHIDELFKSSE